MDKDYKEDLDFSLRGTVLWVIQQLHKQNFDLFSPPNHPSKQS